MSTRGRNSTGNGPDGGRKVKREGYYREYERDDSEDAAEMSYEEEEEEVNAGKFVRPQSNSTKRSISQPQSPDIKPDLKRARLTKDSPTKASQGSSAARRPRNSTSNSNASSTKSRQASKTFVPTLTIQQRPFLTGVEILYGLFPKFYRAFHVSSAISPQSIIHRLAPLSAALAPSHSNSTISSSASSTSESLTSIGSTITNPTTVNS